MHKDISAPYIDTSAAELSWALGLERQDALATLTVALPGGSLELRLLGASHQALLDLGPTTFSEVVACLPGAHPTLPGTASAPLPEGSYAFRSEVLTMDPAAFADHVERLVADLASNPRALVGTFPGSPHAVTALVADVTPTSVAWRTWHAYPQSGELVVTRSEVALR